MKLMKMIPGIMIAGILLLLISLRAPALWGYEIYCVVSGSMEPEIGVGDAVFVKQCEFEELKTGDVVTYSLNEGRNLVTHRITKIDTENQVIQTKGDANEAEDQNWITADTIIGTVRWHIPRLGILSCILSERRGKLYMLAILLWLSALELIIPKERRCV